MAGISLLAHSANRSLSRAAPSSIEYSVCTCRCTNDPLCPLAGLPARAAAMKYRLLQACCHEPARGGRFPAGTTVTGALTYWTRGKLAGALPPAGHSRTQHARTVPPADSHDRVVSPVRVRSKLSAIMSAAPSRLRRQQFERMRQIRAVGAGELDPVTVSGMSEGQPHRVQPLAA